MYKGLTKTGFASANNISKFICDSESDLSSLPTLSNSSSDGAYGPCGVGSIAVVLESQKMYMLSNAGTWEEYGSTSGGGGISASIATLDEVIDYIG